MFIYTTVQKFGLSNIYIFLNTMDTLNCSKVKVKTFMWQKICIANTLCNFGKKEFWTFYSLKNVSWAAQKY